MRPLIRGIARYELVFLGMATPFLLFPGLWTPIGVALIALAWGCRWGSTGRFTKRTPMDIPIILLVVMLCVSLIPSVDLRLSLNRLWIYILGIALFYGMVNGLQNERQIQNMGILLVLVGMAVALVSLVSTDFQSAQLIELPSIYDRLPPPLIRGLPGSGVIEEYDLVNPRVTAGALAILLPVPLAYLVFGEGWKLRLLSGLTALVMAGVLLLTQSPQGLLGVVCALFLILVWRTRWFLLTLPVGLGGLLVAWMVPDLLQATKSWLTSQATGALDFKIYSRLVDGGWGIGMIRDMPYTGIGLNTFPVMNGLYSFGRSRAPHAHNTLIQTAVDAGIPGLIALLALLAAFGSSVVGAYRASSNPNQRALLIGVCGAIAAWLSYGLLDSVTLGHKPAAALWVMVGLTAAMPMEPDGPTADTVPLLSRFSRKWLVPVVVALILLMVLVGLALPKAVGALHLNLGVMEAHRALANASSGDDVADHLIAAEESFRQAVQWDPGRERAHRLLDWVHSLDGDVLSRRWPRDSANVEAWRGFLGRKG